MPLAEGDNWAHRPLPRGVHIDARPSVGKRGAWVSVAPLIATRCPPLGRLSLIVLCRLPATSAKANAGAALAPVLMCHPAQGCRHSRRRCQRQSATRSFTVGPAADTTAPETSIDSGPRGTIASASASFAFSSSGSNSSFQCRLSAAPWQRGESESGAWRPAARGLAARVTAPLWWSTEPTGMGG
jgi:hypothetical protein